MIWEIVFNRLQLGFFLSQGSELFLIPTFDYIKVTQICKISRLFSTEFAIYWFRGANQLPKANQIYKVKTISSGNDWVSPAQTINRWLQDIRSIIYRSAIAPITNKNRVTLITYTPGEKITTPGSSCVWRIWLVSFAQRSLWLFCFTKICSNLAFKSYFAIFEWLYQFLAIFILWNASQTIVVSEDESALFVVRSPISGRIIILFWMILRYFSF